MRKLYDRFMGWWGGVLGYNRMFPGDDAEIVAVTIWFVLVVIAMLCLVVGIPLALWKDARGG